MLTWLQRKTARNRLEAQLFPRLRIDASFRAYKEGDRDACLDVYHKNAPGRFPEDDGAALAQRILLRKTHETIQEQLAVR